MDAAARAGAQVIGCDISTNWLEKARGRAAAEGLEITFEEGDAESLPYADAQFDVVTSLFGAMSRLVPTSWRPNSPAFAGQAV